MVRQRPPAPPLLPRSVLACSVMVGTNGGGFGGPEGTPPLKRSTTMNLLSKLKKPVSRKVFVRSKSGTLTQATGEQAKKASIEINELTTKDLLVDHWLIHPGMGKKVAWDLTVGAMILYSVIIIPYYISFDVKPSGFLMGLDYLVDGCFWVDLFLSFRGHVSRASVH